MRIHTLTFLFFAFIFSLTFAAPMTYASTICKQGTLTRSIYVVYSQPGHSIPCEVVYDKADSVPAMTLWRAENEIGYCEAKAESFTEKLASLGWTCGEPTSEQTQAGEQTNGTPMPPAGLDT